MKNYLLALLVTMFATGALARSIDKTQVIARADGTFAGLKTVALLADGRMQVVSEAGKVKTVFLNEKSFEKLTRDLYRVANVEVETLVKDYICHTFVAIIPKTLERLSVASYDYQAGTFQGKPRLILTERGCFYLMETYPKNERSQSEAAAVREQLVILALANM